MINPAPKGGIAPRSTRVMNLANFLSQAARRHPDAPGFVWGESVWTWAQMEARVEAMAHALSNEFGVTKGDRILVQSSNCNQMFESMFACFRLGAVWAPTNHRQSPGEVARLAEVSGARGMICGAAFPDHARTLGETSSTVEFVIAIGAAGFGEDYDAIVARNLGSRVASIAVARDDPCWFFFTSGTTGRPKAPASTSSSRWRMVSRRSCHRPRNSTRRRYGN